MANRKPSVVDKFMSEHVPLAGVCDVIVTRGFAYQWYKDCGMDPHARGFGSADYMSFGKPATSEPLTNLEEVREFLANVQRLIRKEYQAT